MVKYTEITPLGDEDDKSPVAVEPYTSETPARMFVSLAEHYEEHPESRPFYAQHPELLPHDYDGSWATRVGSYRRVGLEPRRQRAGARARRVHLAPRPRGRRERRHVARSMASADPGDSSGDSEPPAVTWRWASEASWRSFVASIESRDFERELHLERMVGWSR